MRTTLDIAEDVLQAAKELARRQGSTAGQVISDLARQALRQGVAETSAPWGGPSPKGFLGFKPFPSRGGVVTDELIDQLRDGEPE